MIGGPAYGSSFVMTPGAGAGLRWPYVAIISAN